MSALDIATAVMGFTTAAIAIGWSWGRLHSKNVELERRNVELERRVARLEDARTGQPDNKGAP